MIFFVMNKVECAGGVNGYYITFTSAKPGSVAGHYIVHIIVG